MRLFPSFNCQRSVKCPAPVKPELPPKPQNIVNIFQTNVNVAVAASTFVLPKNRIAKRAKVTPPPPVAAPPEPKPVVKDGRIVAVNDRLESLMGYLESGFSAFDSPTRKIESLKALIKGAAFLRKQEPTTDDESTIAAYALTAEALDREFRVRFAELVKPPTPKIVEVVKEIFVPVPVKSPEKPKPIVEVPTTVPAPVVLPPIFDVSGPKSETIDVLLKIRSNWVFEFTELVRRDSAIEKLHSDLRDVRADFWKSLEKKCLSSIVQKDFDILNKDIAFQQEIDGRLLQVLKNEIAQAQTKKLGIRGNLAILKDCMNSCIFDKSPTPADLEVLLALEMAEQRNNHRFLNELKGVKTFFAKHDYKSLATHYDCTIAEFDEIEKQLDGVTDLNKYVADWNVLLESFESQHRLFLKLKAAEQDFESCGNEIGAILYQLNAQNDDKNFEVIANFVFTAPDKAERANLRTSEDIELFIVKLEAFTNEVRIAINALKK